MVGGKVYSRIAKKLCDDILPLQQARSGINVANLQSYAD